MTMVRLYLRGVLVTCLVVNVLFAKASIKITSPAAGTVVHPGDAITVTVSATGASFTQMIVIGQDPIGSSQVLTAPPYQFSIQIPPDVTPGLYALTASGAVSPGNGVESDPVSIDVERVDQPVSITAEPSSLTLAVGERAGLRVVGKYSDNSTVDLTESIQTSYLSKNTAIVTVSKDGFVTAVAPGSTQIIIDGKFRITAKVTTRRQ